MMALRLLSALALICLATAAPIMPVVSENIVAQPDVADVEVREEVARDDHSANDAARLRHYEALSAKLASIQGQHTDAIAERESAVTGNDAAMDVESSSIKSLENGQQVAFDAKNKLTSAATAAGSAANAHGLTEAEVIAKRQYLAAMLAELNKLKSQKAIADQAASDAKAIAAAADATSASAMAAHASATDAAAKAKAAAVSAEQTLAGSKSAIGAELAAAEAAARAAAKAQEEAAAAAATAAAEATAAASAADETASVASSAADDLTTAEKAHTSAAAALATAESAEAAAKADRAKANAALATATADHEAAAASVAELAKAAEEANKRVVMTSVVVENAVAEVSFAAEAMEAAKVDAAVQKAKLCTEGSDTWHSQFCAGCDGVVGSGKVKDLCGVCGGDDSSCKDCAGIPNGKSIVRDWCDWTGCTRGGCENNNGRTPRRGYNGAGWREVDKKWCGWSFSGVYNNERCCRKECY